MGYEGDILAAQVLRFKFRSRNKSGAGVTLSGTPALVVYKDDSTTEEVTTGITLTVDFDGRTGCNHVAIDTSADGTFYAAGHDFQVVISAGTVGGTSVVGAVVGEFSIENRTQKADLRKVGGNAIPTPNVSGVPKVDLVYTLGTISPAQAGSVSIDWAWVANPTSLNALSATTIGTVNTLAANAVSNATFQNNCISSSKVAASTTAAIAAAVWQDSVAGDFTVANSIGKSLYVANVAPGGVGGIAIVGSAMTLAASQHVIVDSGTVTTLTNLPAITAGWITAAGIAASALNGKGDWLLSSAYTAPDNADIATLIARLTAQRATNLDNLDATVSSRLATSGYTAPDNADIVTALSDLVSLLARTDPTSALTAVKTVTDGLATMLTASGPNKTYTIDALKNAPAGGGSGNPKQVTDKQRTIIDQPG